MNTNVVPREPNQEDLGRLYEILEARAKSMQEIKTMSEVSLKKWFIEQIRDICEKMGLIYESVIVFWDDVQAAAKEGWNAGRKKAQQKRLYPKG